MNSITLFFAAGFIGYGLLLIHPALFSIAFGCLLLLLFYKRAS